MTYSLPIFSQSSIRVNSISYSVPTFSQSLIVLIAVAYAVSTFKAITLKQALFGENFRETPTQLILNKQDIPNTKATAEAYFVALFIKWLVANPNLSNISIVYSANRIQSAARINTYWIQFFDYPLDQFNNPDVSQALNPNNF